MKLPNANRAIADEDKLVKYLLNQAHPDNGGKAHFFALLGFGERNWQALADTLKAVATSNSVVDETETVHGTKYVIDGDIAGPAGVSRIVRTVWIVDRGKQDPRLVTAYPSERRA